VKKKIQAILLILIITAVAVSILEYLNTERTYQKFYRHIDLDGAVPVIGKYPVENVAPQMINCYCLIYNDGDSLIEVKYYKEGVLHKDPIFGVSIIKIEYQGEVVKRSYYDINGKSISNKFGVHSVNRKIFNDKNLLLTTNLNLDEEVIADSDGADQYLRLLNDQGRAIKTFLLNESGDTLIDRLGSYESRYKLNNLGDIIEVSTYENDNAAHGNTLKRIRVQYVKYDEYGNIIEISSYNNEGQLKAFKSDDIAIIRVKYDFAGNWLEKRYYNEKDIIRTKAIYDKNGNILELASYDDFGNPKGDEDTGAAIVRLKYDKQNRQVEKRFYGINGKLKESNDIGAAIISKNYIQNEDEFIIETRYCGIDGNLKARKDTGIATEQIKSSANNTIIEYSFYDTDGLLKEDNIDGIAINKTVFDNNNNLLEESYYGADKKYKVIRNFGYAIARCKYDQCDNLIEVNTFGADGKLIETEGISTMRLEYDEQGNVVKRIRLDKNGNIVKIKEL